MSADEYLDNDSWEIDREPETPAELRRRRRGTKKKTVTKGRTTGGGTKKKTTKKKTTKKKTTKKSKKQRHADYWALDNLDKATGAAMAGLLKQTSAKSHKARVSTLREYSGFIIGIPCPSFAVEYLIGNTAIPLEKAIQLYGPRGIGKSGLAFEFMRIWRKHHGLGHLFEHESKFNPIWARSIIGWWDEGMGVIPCSSINDWQTELQWAVRQIKKIMLGDSKTKGSGRIFPWLGIVDSIVGKPFQETIDKIKKEGYAGRGHPVEAMSVGKFITAFSSQMDEWPFALICINHLKVHKGEGGPPTKNRSGGQTIDFQGSFELEVTRKSRIRTAAVDGNALVIKCEKNSYGVDKRSINVNCIWCDDEYTHPETGEVEIGQRTIWDWHASTAKLLTDGKGQLFTDARKLCGGLVRVNEGSYYAPGLGVRKNKPVPPTEIGLKIKENDEIMEGLRDLFSIRRIREFRNDIDYKDQITEMKRQMAGISNE